jgi:hypothetical protein
MPYKSRAEQSAFTLRRMKAIRDSWFAGKCCVWCGSVERLELDHIDPSQKESHKIWGWSEVRRNAELSKCRVLCHRCHKQRSDGQMRKPLIHGTLTTYMSHKCRCTQCRGANNEYRRRLRARRVAGN